MGIVGFCMAPPRDKLEDFKHSSLSVVKPPLGMSFAPFATGIPTDPAELEKLIQDAPGIVARAKENEQLMSEGSVEGLTARTGQFSEHQKKLLERLKSQGRANDGFNILLLDALQNNTLPSFIADQVFDGMGDDDVTALVADIEDKTGRPFEAYARDILGEDLPDRTPGESEADYQRRVLKALTEEMLNPDGTVKAKYADDPLAQYLAEQEVVQEVTVKAKSIQVEVEVTGVTAKLEDETKELSAAFNAADATANAIENAELEAIATDSQDNHSDNDLKSDESIDRANTGFANIPGMPGSA